MKKVIRILWVCNIVLPEFAGEYGISRNRFGGWMSAMLQELEGREDIEIALCFPIRDKERMMSGKHSNHPFFSIHAENDISNYSSEMEDQAIRIIKEYKPDIVHIWGTEYNHSRAAMEACCKCGIEGQTIVDIQGLVSVYACHYASGVPLDFIRKKNELGETIEQEIRNFVERGENEKCIISKAKYVSGRSEWDEYCTRQINKEINYLKCHRILKRCFYSSEKRWDIEGIDRYSIFVSQGTYAVKGLHYLISALPIVLQLFPKTRVIVSGVAPIKEETNKQTPYGAFIKQMIESFGVEKAIEFVGVKDEETMIEHYVKAHISVSPSNIENLSNSICEAMVLGTPVIASDVGGVKTIITHNRNGLLYQHDAPYMLAGNICKLFSDDNFAIKLSDTAKSDALERHNPIILGETMYKNYMRVLKG